MLVRVHLISVDTRCRHIATENGSGTRPNDQIAKNRLQNRNLCTLKYREQSRLFDFDDFAMMKNAENHHSTAITGSQRRVLRTNCKDILQGTARLALRVLPAVTWLAVYRWLKIPRRAASAWLQPEEEYR